MVDWSGEFGMRSFCMLALRAYPLVQINFDMQKAKCVVHGLTILSYL